MRILISNDDGIEAPGIVVYGDGERIGPTPVDIELVPGALRVLV